MRLVVWRRSQELHAPSRTAAITQSAVVRITAFSSADTVKRFNMEVPKATPAISPKKGKYLDSVAAVELRTYLKNLGFFEVPGDGTERLRQALAGTSVLTMPQGVPCLSAHSSRFLSLS